uniref:B box-type domain-containing protein n=1 Tax=Romanomermis culicivorax TaxID=13658 RepID=A0A915IH69_ROMCU
MNRISSPKDNDAHSAAANEESGDDFSQNDLSSSNNGSSPTSSSMMQQQKRQHLSTAFGELDGPLLASGDMDCPFCRQPYKQPRLLMCLHAFCEQCIVAMLENGAQRRVNGTIASSSSSIFTSAGRLGALSATTSLLELDGGGRTSSLLDCELESSNVNEAPPPPGVVRCPICKQDSQIGNDLRFVQSLQLDFVTMNLQDATAFEHQQLICESCKTKEKAVARCQDCANVLCPNCVQAHQFMRCFENHKVLTFEEMKNAEKSPAALAHRPITCPQHPSETIRLFCATCRVPVCNECLLSTHKFADHNFLKPTSETESAARDRLKSLIEKGHIKINRCNNENQEIESKLEELQVSVDQAKISVEFAFEKYQTLLNNRREKLLIDLNQLQTKLENEILRTSQQIGNTSEKIRDAIGFTERLLKHGNVMELLCSMSVVEAQLLQVIHSVPSAQFQVKINFVNDEKLFDQALPQITGYFHAGLEHQLPQQNFSTDQLSNLLAQSTGGSFGGSAQHFGASSIADFGFSTLSATAQNQTSSDFPAPVFGSCYLNGQINDAFLPSAGPSLTPSYLLGR